MNYRNTRCYLNCEKRIFEGVGSLDSPVIQPEEVDVANTPLIGFNYAKTELHPENKIVHFYVDDYQFERVWNNPDVYLSVLKRFKAVLSPDFSMYADFPRAVQMFNHYRKQWCGAYWQSFGIKVIPTIGWVDEDSYDWCYDGIPKHSLVCISTVGAFARKEDRKNWLIGYKHSIDVLQPSEILFYGKMYPQIEVPCPYTLAVNQNTLNRMLARQRMDEEAKKNGII